jgi:hypothetical protein
MSSFPGGLFTSGSPEQVTLSAYFMLPIQLTCNGQVILILSFTTLLPQKEIGLKGYHIKPQLLFSWNHQLHGLATIGLIWLHCIVDQTTF